MTDGSGDLIDGALRVSGQAPRDLSIVFSIPTFAVTGRAQYSALRENASDPVPVVLSGPGLAFDLETQLQAGAFEFPHVPSGDYTLQLGPGAMPVRFRVAETDVRMEMEITSIRGRVLFPAGSAAPAIVLSLSPSGAPDATVYVRPNVSADGAFTLPIPVGSYSASIAGYLPGYTLSVNNGGDLLQAGQTFAVSRENAVELQVVSGQ
jgi:hypothetical protein